MKKSLFIMLIAIFSFSYCNADQLELLTKEQAIKAVDLLKNQQLIISWCSCCDKDSDIIHNFQRVFVRNVYYKMVDLGSNDPNNYYVVVQGINTETRAIFDTNIDLAYILINNKDLATSVAEVLKYPFDKCYGNTDWNEIATPTKTVKN